MTSYWLYYEENGELNTHDGAMLFREWGRYADSTNLKKELDLIVCLKLNEGVKIDGGSGIESDPYILSITK